MEANGLPIDDKNNLVKSEIWTNFFIATYFSLYFVEYWQK
jgi:hypothetical protein